MSLVTASLSMLFELSESLRDVTTTNICSCSSWVYVATCLAKLDAVWEDMLSDVGIWHLATTGSGVSRIFFASLEDVRCFPSLSSSSCLLEVVAKVLLFSRSATLDGNLLTVAQGTSRRCLFSARAL